MLVADIDIGSTPLIVDSVLKTQYKNPLINVHLKFSSRALPLILVVTKRLGDHSFDISYLYICGVAVVPPGFLVHAIYRNLFKLVALGSHVIESS